MILQNGAPAVVLQEAVLFPFDDHSLPFQYSLELGLIASGTRGGIRTIVLSGGEEGEPDCATVRFCGSVLRVGDEFRMWYIGIDQQPGVEPRGWRVCYAVSRDGVKWQKPALGLVEYKGSTQNNLVRIDSKFRHNIVCALVLHDSEDPDRDRRFKMLYHAFGKVVNAAFSPDGLHWKDSPHSPIIRHTIFEPGGLCKFNSVYYMSAHGGHPPKMGHYPQKKRDMVTFVSYDFENWVEAPALGLKRDAIPERWKQGSNAGEQTHLGAALWDRGNVVLGFYGQWHGPESNDRAFVTMDLGLAVSNDCLHFREPVPDFKIIPAAEVFPRERHEFAGPYGSLQIMPPGPSLMQGQGFENTEEETLNWYSPWRGGFVCVARWERDRLGYLGVIPEPRPPVPASESVIKLLSGEEVRTVRERAAPHCISCPIHLNGQAAQLFVNASGLSGDSSLLVEILDHQFRPVAGYSGDTAVPVTESGFRQQVSWPGKESLQNFNGPIRIKVSWLGARQYAALLHAIYLTSG